MALFVSGFETYINNEEFSDVTLIDKANGMRYFAHRIILANSSDKFASLLSEFPNQIVAAVSRSRTGSRDLGHRRGSSTGSSSSTTTSSSDTETHNSLNTSRSEQANSAAATPVGTPMRVTATVAAATAAAAAAAGGLPSSPKPLPERAGGGGPGSSYVVTPAARVELALTADDPGKMMPVILNFMYTGKVTITRDNCVVLLALADFYQVRDLKALVSLYITSNITRENALNMLSKAVESKAGEIISQCTTVIAKNFQQMRDIDCTAFTVEILLRLLSHPKLAVKTEWTVYEVANRYCTFHTQLTPATIYDIFACVRWPWMTSEQLEEASRNPAVPPSLLIEGLLVRLKRIESGTNVPAPPELASSTEVAAPGSGAAAGAGAVVAPATAPSPAPPSAAAAVPPPIIIPSGTEVNLRLIPRMTYGVHFEYRSDFDDGGILYYVATNGGRRPWTNPAIPVTIPPGLKAIKVSASSIQKGSPLLVVGRDLSEFWTKDIPASWFEVDFGAGRAVVPTTYTLRHGGNYKADSLRNWDLQGSNDQTSWHVLARHQNDDCLQGNFATHTWPVRPGTNSYRYLRILQTGRNSSNHNFLCLSGFEVYGELFDDTLLNE